MTILGRPIGQRYAPDRMFPEYSADEKEITVKYIPDPQDKLQIETLTQELEVLKIKQAPELSKRIELMNEKFRGFKANLSRIQTEYKECLVQMEEDTVDEVFGFTEVLKLVDNLIQDCEKATIPKPKTEIKIKVAESIIESDRARYDREHREYQEYYQRAVYGSIRTM